MLPFSLRDDREVYTSIKELDKMLENFDDHLKLPKPEVSETKAEVEEELPALPPKLRPHKKKYVKDSYNSINVMYRYSISKIITLVVKQDLELKLTHIESIIL